jgi:hypothetical protein
LKELNEPHDSRLANLPTFTLKSCLRDFENQSSQCSGDAPKSPLSSSEFWFLLFKNLTVRILAETPVDVTSRSIFTARSAASVLGVQVCLSGIVHLKLQQKP